MHQELLALSHFPTHHTMTAHARKKLLLPIRVRVHIDLVPVVVSVEEAAFISEAFNPGGGSNQVEEELVAETQASGPAVSIATYSPKPEMLITTIP